MGNISILFGLVILVIESGARQYVKIIGTGQPIIKEQPPVKAPSKASNPLTKLFPGFVFKGTQSQEQQAIISDSQPLTKQQVGYQSFKNWIIGMRSFILNRQKLEGQKGRIQPEGQYVMQEEGPTWSKGQVLLGSQVIGLYDQVQMQNKRSSLEYLKGTGKLIKQVREIPAGSLFYPEESGFVVATPEAQERLGFYKGKGYQPESDIGFYKSPSQPYDVLKQIKGTSGAKAIIGSQAMMSYGMPFLYSGIMQGGAGIERQWQEYSFSGLKALPDKGESTYSALGRQLTSLEVIFDVYLPVSMMGIGVVMKPIISLLASRVGSRLAGINTAKMLGGQYVKFSALGIAKTIGTGAMLAVPAYIVGSTALRSPESLPSVLGHMSGQAILGGASFSLGSMAYDSMHTIPSVIARQSPWNINVRSFTVSGLKKGSLSETLVMKSAVNPMEVGFYSKIMGTDIVSTGFVTPLKISDKIGGKPITYDFSVVSGETMYPSGGFVRRVKELRGKNVFDFSVDGTINMRYAEGGFGTTTINTRSILPGRSFNIKELQYPLMKNIRYQVDTVPSSGFSLGKFIDVPRSDLAVTTYHGFTPETSYEGISFGKNILGEQTYNKVGNINFIGERGQEYERVISFMKFKTGEKSLDIAKIITPRIKGKEYFGSPGGFDTSGLTTINKGIQDALRMPGGGFSGLSLRTRGYQGVFSKMSIPGRSLSLSQLEDLEYGIQSSGHWNIVVPSLSLQSSGFKMKNILGSTQKSELKSSSILATVNISSLKTLNINKILQGSSVKSMTGQKTISLTGTKQVTDVLSIQGLKLDQVLLTTQNVMPTTIAFGGFVAPDIITTRIPFIPFVPIGGLPGWPGGGYGGGRRRKKGARHRKHPVELYDILQMRVTI